MILITPEIDNPNQGIITKKVVVTDPYKIKAQVIMPHINPQNSKLTQKYTLIHKQYSI
jgi:hypothetical protein